MFWATFTSLQWAADTNLMTSLLLSGGQPVPNELEGDVVFQLSPAKQGP